MQTIGEIKIYVADLAAYNAGHLHGQWIDATQEPEDIQSQVDEMLKKSPIEFAEEYAIHDFEGFEGYRLGEYDGIEKAHRVAAYIEEHGKLGAALLEYYGDDLEEAEKAMTERYAGQYLSLADYAQELTEETAEIPEHLASYIDYEKMGRDMDLSGDVLTFEFSHEEVHIFYAN